MARTELEHCDCDECKDKTVTVITNWKTFYTPMADMVDIELESDGEIIGRFRFPTNIAGALGRNWKQFDTLAKK